jgi:hypothetical protein
MIMLVMLAVVLFLFWRDYTRYTQKRTSFVRPMLSGTALAFLAVYVICFYFYYPWCISNFYNGGYGVTFTSQIGNASIVSTFWDWTDKRVGEYFAITKAEDSFTIMVFPFALWFLVIYLMWILLSPFISKNAPELKVEDFNEEEM